MGLPGMGALTFLRPRRVGYGLLIWFSRGRLHLYRLSEVAPNLVGGERDFYLW